MTASLLFLLLTGAAVGAAAGYLGSFMILKRMSLVGDALSHVALPGMAIAIMWHTSPIIGALAALTLAVIGIWHLQNHSSVYPDALVGIFFTASLSIGILITPQPDLLEALFGDLATISVPESLLAVFFSLVLIAVTYIISRRLLLTTISEDLATTSGIPVSKINLIYYLLVGAVVALGVKFVGTLLTGALVIIPAAAAKNLSRSLTAYSLLSIFFGLASAVIGVLIARSTGVAPGPIVVLTSVTFFLVTLVLKSLSR